MPASTSHRSPACFRSAADTVSKRAASSRVAMSASFNWIAWCSAIGRPIVSRCCAYASAASKAARATPTTRAAMLMRPTSRTLRICREAAARRTDQRIRGQPVLVVRHLDGLDAPVAELADVLRHGDTAVARARLLLDDERRDAFIGTGCERDDARSFPVRDPRLGTGDDPLFPVALPRHEMLRVSVPASGSDNESAPRGSPVAIRGSHRACCSSVPNAPMSVAHMLCVLTTPESDIHPYASSSTTPMYVSRSSPRPPRSSGMVIPKSPRSLIVATISAGYSSACSIAFATGMTSRATNLRTVAIISARTAGSVGAFTGQTDRIDTPGGAGRAVELRVADLRIAGYLPLARPAPQLQHDLVHLTQTRRADGFSVRDEAAVGVDRKRSADLERAVGIQRLPARRRRRSRSRRGGSPRRPRRCPGAGSTSTSSGPIPAISYAARDASTVGPTVSSIGSHGLCTSNAPSRRVRTFVARR